MSFAPLCLAKWRCSCNQNSLNAWWMLGCDFCAGVHRDMGLWGTLSCWRIMTVTNSICYGYVQFSSVQSLSHVWLFATPWTTACQASLSITNSGAYSNLRPSSWWCHPTISFSVILFSSCLQSISVIGPFLMSKFFTSVGQSIWVSASVLPVNI